MLQLLFFCNDDEPKFGLVKDRGDRLQSRDVPFGISGDLSVFYLWKFI